MLKKPLIFQQQQQQPRKIILWVVNEIQRFFVLDKSKRYIH